MNGNKTMIAAIILLLMASSYFLLESRDLKKARDEEKKSAVFTAEPENIGDFSLTSKSQLTQFRREGENWFMTSPQKLTASPDDIMQFLTLLSALGKDQIIAENPEDPGEYGLNPPAMILTLRSGEKEETLLMGKRNYSGTHYYAKKEPNPEIFTISSFIGESLEKDGTAFLEKGAFPRLAADKVLELSVSQSGKTVLLKNKSTVWSELGKNSSWIIAEPAKSDADENAVAAYLAGLRNLSPFGWEEGIPAEKEEKALLALSVLQRELPSDTLWILAKEENAYLCKRKSTGETFRISLQTGEALFAGYGDFVDRRILTVNPSEITKVEIRCGGKRLEAEKDGSWKLAEPQKGKEIPSLNALLWNLENLRYEEKIPEYSSKGEIGVTLISKDGASAFTLDGGGILSTEEGGVYKISEELGEILNAVLEDAFPQKN